MNTSDSHQEFKKGYNVPEGEEKFFHILFIDILKDGKRTRDVPVVQKYKGKEWKIIERNIHDRGIAVTGHDEYSVLHDPSVKPPKPKGRPKVTPEANPDE